MIRYQDRFSNTEYNIMGIHLSNVPMLVSIEEDIHYNECAEAIESFTSFQPIEHLKYRSWGFHLTKGNHKIYKLEFEDTVIQFSKFSDLEAVTTNKNRILMKLELLSEKKRVGNCHYEAMYFSQYFGKKLVTAYIDDSTGFYRIVHSFIEDDDNVYDYTKNLVMNKKDYYQLFQVEIINVIDRETFMEDLKNPFFMKFIDCKFYCLFRDELMNGHTFGVKQEDEIETPTQKKFF